MKTLMQMPLTLAVVQGWARPAVTELIQAMGDQPNAVFDFVSMQFTDAETRLTVAAYRNLDAWHEGRRLPATPVIELRLTRAEHLALAQSNEAYGALETSVRAAAWSVMQSHPQMLRGEENVFTTGSLIEVE